MQPYAGKPGPGLCTALLLQGIVMGEVDYSIETEVLKGSGCEHHRLGEKFKYPEEIGEI